MMTRDCLQLTLKERAFADPRDIIGALRPERNSSDGAMPINYADAAGGVPPAWNPLRR